VTPGAVPPRPIALGKHKFAKRGEDLYETPPVATEALLRREDLPKKIWEPAAGKGAIVRVLRAAGREVVASDLVDYGFPLHRVADFLTETKAPDGCTAIVTNPPYKVVNKFVAHALELAPLVIVLLRLMFIESRRRRPILESGKLARSHVFENRLPMMHRDGWTGPKTSSAVPYAWFVFSRDNVGPTTIRRISWEPKPALSGPGNIAQSHGDHKMTKSNLNIVAQPDADPAVDRIEAAPDDPFDLSKLRLSQDFVETAGVKKLLTTVPVRKPNPQDFVRVHPDPGYRMELAVIELKDDREIFLLPPSIAQELPGEFVMVTLYTTINRQGVVHLWPVRLPASDGRINEWHRSAAEAAELAMTRWLRVKANMSLGAYEMFEAASTIPDPKWPELSFQELLRIAFRDRLVSNLDHPIIKRLRGA
jgi:hypothetical protein